MNRPPDRLHRRLLAWLREGLLREYRWVFALILCAGIVLNLAAIWSVTWLPMADLGGWIELMDVVGRYDDPSTVYSEIYTLHAGPEPSTLALMFGWLVVPLIPARVAAHILITLYIIGLPLSVLALCHAFGRSKWLALFSVPLSFNMPFIMGFLNFLLGLPVLFLAIALAKGFAERGRWWRGVLLAACIVVLYFSHVLLLIVGWGVCLAVLLMSSQPRRYHLRLWPLLPVLPLFVWWVWRTLVALEPTEFVHPGLDLHFVRIYRSGLFLFHDGTDDFFLVVLLLAWFAMIALAQSTPRARQGESGILAFTRRYSLEIVTLCCIVAYFCLPFRMHGLFIVAERIVIIAALLLSAWPRLEFDRWSRRAVLVPLVAAVLVFPFLVRDKFRTFERDVLGDMPRAIEDLPAGSRLACQTGDGLSQVIRKQVLSHIPQAIHHPANGGITDRSWAGRSRGAVRYREGQTPRTLPKRFWRKEALSDYDYVLLMARERPNDVLEARRLNLVFNDKAWWLFEILDPRDPEVRKRWAAGKDMQCDGPDRFCGANVVLIIIDTLRWDHLGHYGYERNTTPRLDELSRTSVVFDRAYTHTGWTHPSVTSIMTSLHPNEHGVTQWSHRLKKERLLLSEVLQAKGYHTRAHVSHLLFKPAFGYRQGWDEYDFSVLKKGDPHGISSSKEISDSGVEALNEMPEPFFLWLHYFDPHSDYINHEEFDFPGDRPFDHYDSEIAYTDHHIGRVIQELERTGLMDRTIVVVVSDHGEEFWDHGSRYHDGKLYEELIHIPLLFKIPGIAHQRVGEVVVESDIAPSILHLLGIPIPEQFKGTLIPFGPDGVEIENRIVYADVRRKGKRRALLMDDFKLIHTYMRGGVELYNLIEDPKEKNDLSEQDRERTARYLKKLLDFYEETDESPEEFELGDDLTRKLRSLGYLQ